MQGNDNDNDAIDNVDNDDNVPRNWGFAYRRPALPHLQGKDDPKYAYFIWSYSTNNMSMNL